MKGPAATIHKINEQLVCPVCLSSYVDPRVLPCLHSFCLDCIRGIVSTKSVQQYGSRTVASTPCVTCPMCRKEAIVKDGPKSLPVNFLINGLLDTLALPQEDSTGKRDEECAISSSIRCDECEHATATARCLDCLRYLCGPDRQHHQRAVCTRGHKVVGLSELRGLGATALRRPSLCAEHPGEELKLFCETCDKPICRDCTLVDHSKHKFEFLNKAGEKHKAAMKALLQKANARGPSLQTSVVAVDQAVDAVNKRAASDRAFVSAQIHHYMKALKDREAMLLAEVESVRHKHESTLQAKKHDLEVALAVVRSGCEFVEKALQAGGDAELMAMRGTVTCHMKELIQPVGAEAKLETISETTLPRTDMEEDRKALSDAIHIFGATPGGVSVVKERNQLKAELERLKAELKQAAVNSDKEVQRLKNELEQQKRTSDNLRTQMKAQGNRPFSYNY